MTFNTLRDEAEELGIAVVVSPVHAWRRQSLIGIHLLQPTNEEFEAAIRQAERDLFPTIFIYGLTN